MMLFLFKKTGIFLLIGVGVIFFLWSCGDSKKPKISSPVKPVKKEKISKPKVVNPSRGRRDEDQDEVAYAYNPVGKRDPFQVFVATSTVRPDVPLTPLQRFRIDQLKLIGIIWGISNPHAMVQDPRGKGHVLKRGTLIGKNWGKVARIKPDEVIISEEFRDIDGRLVVNEISLKLPKPKRLEEAL